MKLADLVKGTVKLVRVESYNLWYRHAEHDFEFPVPVSETNGACFLAEEKGLLFMRWIRPHLKMLEEAKQATIYNAEIIR